jgi:hypothetical protein
MRNPPNARRRRPTRPPNLSSYQKTKTKKQVDLHRLRRLAAVRGLGTHALRSRAWPLLLGAARPALSDAADLAALAQSDHRDRSTVEVDVARSLWAFTDGWEAGARDAVRAGLKRVLNAAVAAGEGTGSAGEKERVGAAPATAGRPASPSPPPQASASATAPSTSAPVHYYQGLHDVASVLLLVTGSEPAAFRLLRRLCVGPLRDCTRRTLAPALGAVSLLPTLLASADPALATHLAPTPPHYALPWHLTWFAHGTPPGPGALAGAARLFDLFAATHPLMPLYVAAAALISGRDALLAADGDDPGEIHAAVGRLPHLGGLDPDAAALRALELYAAHPPAALVRAAAAGGGGGRGGGGASGAVRAWVRRRRKGGGGGGNPPGAGHTPPPGPGPQASAAASARLGGQGFWEVGGGEEEEVGEVGDHPGDRRPRPPLSSPPKAGGEETQTAALSTQGNVLTTVVVSAVGLALWVLSARSGGGAPL